MTTNADACAVNYITVIINEPFMRESVQPTILFYMKSLSEGINEKLMSLRYSHLQRIGKLKCPPFIVYAEVNAVDDLITHW